jgi:hypothetical protein
MHEKSQSWKVKNNLILELEIVRLVMEKVVRMLKNVVNAKEEK